MNNLLPHPIAARYPLLSGDEYESFKASIQSHGQEVEIVLFDGKILDGRNRYRACMELGIEPKTRTFIGTEREAEVRSDVLNLDRRHLSREQKRDVIAYKLRENPNRSDRSIAVEVKVDHKTVAAVRKTACPTGEFPQLRKGRDGRNRVGAKKEKAKPQTGAKTLKPSTDARHLPQLAHQTRGVEECKRESQPPCPPLSPAGQHRLGVCPSNPVVSFR